VKSGLRRRELEALPRREELEALSRYYHHLKNEHERARPGGGVRRRLEDRLLRVRDRFDRLLEEWVPEPELHAAWRAYLHHRGPEPSGPSAIRPLVFRGRSEAGSLVEIRGKGDDLNVEVDGALVERIAGEKDFAVDRPVVRFRLEGVEVHETFAASPAAHEALAAFRDEGGPPPWEHASELLVDGLIDVHFDLTPRGRRALEHVPRSSS
jgi:hypothetical protein